MTMIERVADALRESVGRSGQCDWFDPEGAARAAIEAMREPTDEMLANAPVAPSTRAQIWKAMIDSALAGG